MQPLVEAERKKRHGQYDPERWQIYFENLYHLTLEHPPEKVRSAQQLWRLQKPDLTPTHIARVRQDLSNKPGEKEISAD